MIRPHVRTAGLVLLVTAAVTLLLLASVAIGFAGQSAGAETPDPSVSIDQTPPCPAGTATPPGTDCLPCPTAAPLGVQSTCPPLGHVVLWGDADCSGEANPVDALFTIRYDAGLTTNTGVCPDMGQQIAVLGVDVLPWGDVDCDQNVNPIDALKLLRFDAFLSVNQGSPCVSIGDNVPVNNAP